MAERSPTIIEELELTVAFPGLRRTTPGHALVVTKRHVATLLDLSDAEARAVFSHARRLADAVTSAFGPEALWLHQNNGAASGQSVPHFHLHVVPLRGGDRPWDLQFWIGEEVSIEERTDIARQIRANLPP